MGVGRVGRGRWPRVGEVGVRWVGVGVVGVGWVRRSNIWVGRSGVGSDESGKFRSWGGWLGVGVVGRSGWVGEGVWIIGVCKLIELHFIWEHSNDELLIIT